MNNRVIIENIPKDAFDWTDDHFEYLEEEYIQVSDNLMASDGDGHKIVVQRKSDKKYFEYFWVRFHSGKYVFSEKLKEVFPKEIITIIYE